MHSETAARLLIQSHPSLSETDSSASESNYQSHEDDSHTINPVHTTTQSTLPNPSSRALSPPPSSHGPPPLASLVLSSPLSSSPPTIAQPRPITPHSSPPRAPTPRSSTPRASTPRSPVQSGPVPPSPRKPSPSKSGYSRPSINVNHATPSNYAGPFTVKSPPALRKKQSELALRLGDVMGEIHRHEKEKRDIAVLTHRSDSSATQLRRPSHSAVNDWKPYEERNHHRATETLQGDLSIKPTRSRLSQLITVRSHPLAQAVAGILADLRYLYLSIFLTLVSLYLHDLCYAVMPKTADPAVSGVLMGIFVVFCVEIVVQCLVKAHYLFSFFFFMDLIGTASLIFDIDFIVNSFWSDTSLTSTSTASNQVTQSASVIRLTRFARVLRVIRLVRIVRLFRYHAPIQSKHPSKVGLHLGGLIDKRVILMLLGMVIILPFLTADPAPDDQSPALALDLLTDAQNWNDFNTVVSQLTQTQGDDVFYLFVQGSPVTGSAGVTVIDQRASETGLRVDELDEYTSGLSVMMLSIRQTVYLSACYSMATTSLIILVFASGSWLISRHVHVLVVAPLERMTQIIRKLAGTVCFLTAATEADGRELDDGLETEVIEATISKMARIFAVQPDGNNALPKPLQMMAGTKHTEIMTQSSIVSIEVIERPKALLHEGIVDDGSVSEDKKEWLDVDLTVHKELSSIDEILTHPQVIPYFDLYLTSCFVSENLQFSTEVDRFRSIFKTHALHLHISFISARAHNAINVDSKTKQTIADHLDEPHFTLFDDAQKECLDGLRGHWRPFIKSRWCRGYVRKAEEMETRRLRMQQNKKKRGSDGRGASGGGEVEAVSILPGSGGGGNGEWEGGERGRAMSDDRVTRGTMGRTGTMQDFPGAVNLESRAKEED